MGSTAVRRGTWRQALALAVLMGVLSAGAMPALADTDDKDGGLLSSLLPGGSSSPAQRAAVTPEPTGQADRVTPPTALIRPEFVSATATTGSGQVPLIVPRSALPFRFMVDRRLAQRFGERAVYDAIRQWDDVPGSRWATSYGGLVDGVTDAPDGRSVIFLKDNCPASKGGYAYWQTTTAHADARYGARAVYLTEVDIAVCTAVEGTTGLRQILAHEIAHAFGLDHLCDPGQECWQPGMGQGPHGCRLMSATGGPCSPRIDGGDREGVVHLYPKLERLAGPSRVETAARASYAAFAQGSAPVVVVADAGGPAHGPLAAAALSGRLGAPFLLGTPDSSACLSGAAAEELSRVAASSARVLLVGSWPAACTGVLSSWGMHTDRVDGRTSVALGVAVAQLLADSGRLGGAAVLVSAAADAHGHVPDGVAGGAAAAAAGGPILYTGRDGLDPAVRGWLQEGGSSVRTVYLLGGTAALSARVATDLAGLGVAVTRVAGPSRVDTAIALASRSELFTPGGPVVVATAGSWPDAVTGSAVGARSGAPVLLTPARGHAALESWLAQRRPAGGWVVGGHAAVPYELQWRFARYAR